VSLATCKKGVMFVFRNYSLASSKQVGRIENFFARRLAEWPVTITMEKFY
jgi:hypothetical protein